MLPSQIIALRWGRVSQDQDTHKPTKTAINKGTYIAGECSGLQNNAGTGVSDWHKIDTTETPFVLTENLEKKKPATAATVNGSDSNETANNSQGQHTLSDNRYQILIWAKAMICGLSKLRRVTLAFAILNTLDRNDRAAIVSHCQETDAVGSPLPTFWKPMPDANFWADLATKPELEAYALASFNRMSPRRQSAFLEFVQGRAAA